MFLRPGTACFLQCVHGQLDAGLDAATRLMISHIVFATMDNEKAVDHKEVVVYLNSSRCENLDISYFQRDEPSQRVSICKLLAVALELSGDNKDKLLDYLLKCLQKRDMAPTLRWSDHGPGWFVLSQPDV